MRLNFKKVEEKRKLIKLSQVELSALCKIPYNTYSKYVKGTNTLDDTTERTKRILKVLNTYFRLESEIKETQLLELKIIELDDLIN
jgi:transcriptional regulator with XRE-family HTH domain